MGELKCAECGASIDLDGDHWFYDDGRGYWHQDPLACEALRLRSEVARLRECVEAANAMARALLDKSSGAHECNGGPDRCWYCADNESDRAVVAAYDIARAALDAGEEKR